MNDDERAALAAWADDDDPSDAFTEKVLCAWFAEQAGSTEEGVVEEPALTSEPRAAASRRRAVGWVGALATAAVVMLMVRVLPRASEVERETAGHACAPAMAQERGPADERGRHEPMTPGAVSAEPESTVLGAQAGQVLAHHCNPCHDSTLPDAKTGALEVFDLDKPYWWSTMSDAQLEDASLRVRELAGSTDDERERVGTFVQAELQRRARAG
ncbi:hypothetical protein OEB96_32440 [Paraliomyxa miuraensis]|nr:hypothetical protein [Paraliomyxa miuraensis]